MSRHTPGPWVINRDESTNSCDSEKLSIEGGALYIAQVDHCMHQEANAALIAAAPDLLKALEMLILFTKPTKTNSVALHNAYQAVASANGESK